MCEGRYRDGGTALYDWAEPEVLVVCPQCSSAAVVRAASAGRRLSCSSCGFTRSSDGRSSTWGRPADPWFGAPLWLQAPFRDHIVWAFNPAHLQALRAYVAAELRERDPRPGAPTSMLEKLPDWMTSAKNRDAVLAVLHRIGERVTARTGS